MPRSTDRALEALLAALERELPDAVALRQRLHAMPELAHSEHETQRLIASELPVGAQPIAGTGLLALIEGDGAPVAVRAELDAVAVKEKTGAAFAAGGDAMHACGHDVHMAALVALVRAAHALGEDLPGALLAIFQPSEEAYPSGAELIAQEGLGARSPRAIVAAHVHPELAWGTAALDEGTVNASCDAFEITVHGEPSHGAYPHLGRDPILALAEIVVALHARAGRLIDPVQTASLSVGVLAGGSADNVIPAQATARGALRAHRPQERDALRSLVGEVVDGVCSAHGCRGELAITAGEPALLNDPRLAAAGRALLVEAGFRLTEPWRSCGSDDFAFFSPLAPIAIAFVGLAGAPGFQEHPLHHPELLVPDAAVGAIARAQAALVAGAWSAAASV
jgi:amidohydrolase